MQRPALVGIGRGVRPLINYTGGTEASGALLSSVVVRPIRPAGLNTASPGVQTAVVDTEGKPMIGATGELAVLAPFVGMTRSFWQDDARYLDTYWSRVPGIWVHGDLAVQTRAGDFFMLGRSDDTLKVAGKRQNVGAGLIAYLLCGAFEIGGGPAAHDNLCPFLGQRLRTRAAQPLAGAADDRHFIFQFQIHTLRLLTE